MNFSFPFAKIDEGERNLVESHYGHRPRFTAHTMPQEAYSSTRRALCALCLDSEKCGRSFRALAVLELVAVESFFSLRASRTISSNRGTVE